MAPILVKQAVASVVGFINEVMTGPPVEDVAVEEVELSEDGRRWTITMGYYPPGTSISRFTGKEIARRYRTFEVDSETGQVLSMKIRKP